jgi:hypothetical protein
VRRIAIESVGKDETAYAKDPWSDPISGASEDTARRNLADLAEFRLVCARRSPAELMMIFPELFSDAFDGAGVIAMYKRWAQEAGDVWSRYPNLAPFLA